MEDSNSSQPSKCPCGFWGSASTQGLCSRCYKEHVQKSKEAMQSSPSGKPGLSSKDKPDTSLRVPAKVPTTASTSKGDNCHKTPSSSVCDSSLDGPACSASRLQSVLSPVLSQNSNKTNNTSKPDVNKDSASSSRVVLDTGLSNNEVTVDSAITSSVRSSNNSTENCPSSSTDTTSSTTPPEQRGTKRPISDVQDTDTAEKSPQKSKKRCNQCNCKLELAQRTIGQCRCGCIFCPLHRLPELHNCDFDHKEDGRREAREKMLKPTRHMGRSCKRIDSDS